MLLNNQYTNSQYTSAKNAASKSVKAKAQSTKKTVIAFMLFSLLGLGSILAINQAHAADVNLFEKSYKAQNNGTLVSMQANPDTKMYVSNHKDEDNITMLESGYDLMGASAFEAGDVSADLALQHAKSIKADTVLVYSKYGSAKTASSKIQMIKEAAKKNNGEIDQKDLEQETEYNYYASYWAKLPMPLLGVHVIKLKAVPNEDDADKTASKDDKGLKIIAVIKDSPAAKANLVKGDMLLKIGDVDLVKPDDLFVAVKRYAGQTVAVTLKRDEADVNTTVALNSRK